MPSPDLSTRINQIPRGLWACSDPPLVSTAAVAAATLSISALTSRAQLPLYLYTVNLIGVAHASAPHLPKRHKLLIGSLELATLAITLVSARRVSPFTALLGTLVAYSVVAIWIEKEPPDNLRLVAASVACCEVIAYSSCQWLAISPWRWVWLPVGGAALGATLSLTLVGIRRAWLRHHLPKGNSNTQLLRFASRLTLWEAEQLKLVNHRSWAGFDEAYRQGCAFQHPRWIKYAAEEEQEFLTNLRDPDKVELDRVVNSDLRKDIRLFHLGRPGMAPDSASQALKSWLESPTADQLGAMLPQVDEFYRPYLLACCLHDVKSSQLKVVCHYLSPDELLLALEIAFEKRWGHWRLPRADAIPSAPLQMVARFLPEGAALPPFRGLK